ncbi:LysE/ArgO family amino acid transporter [Georgenia thermotolerans]|uniref:Amino acid transporter n=1 Tax=Georgenia thermotolerans TaxID=527326 RepID=A0A7J5US62_9MICO|nr:LysE/ArgO family amino acid transporter [Georgenia thermotolerans]KAE8765302.1 amino acid transporter [Georgenia thermotolerans]
MSSVLPGLLTGLSLIVAIGAQNAFVLRQGLTRNHIAVVVAICAVSDALLITLGVSGVGAVVREHPTALAVLRWVGAAYLLAYGLRSLWSARRPQGLDPLAGRAVGRRRVVATTLALTYLNPHVYLDTVLMLGSVANQYGPDRWWFAAGAVAGSLLWFTALGFGARAAAPVLRRPATWRALDVVIGAVMIVLAVRLATG